MILIIYPQVIYFRIARLFFEQGRLLEQPVQLVFGLEDGGFQAFFLCVAATGVRRALGIKFIA
jgi:hypothetical protein